MPLRRRRPLLRTAMVGGAAYHAGKRINQSREMDAQQEARLQELENQPQQAAAPMPAATQAVSTDSTIEQLTKLGELRSAGVLTDAEFEQQKQKILGS